MHNTGTIDLLSIYSEASFLWWLKRDFPTKHCKKKVDTYGRQSRHENLISRILIKVKKCFKFSVTSVWLGCGLFSLFQGFFKVLALGTFKCSFRTFFYFRFLLTFLSAHLKRELVQ